MDLIYFLTAVAIIAVALYWEWRDRKHRTMLVSFTERLTMPDTQIVQLHVNKTVDIAASAVDSGGNSIVLTNLDFNPDESPVGTQEVDADATDANAALVCAAEVGATAVLDFVADGPGGAKFEAKAEITLVAEDVEVGEMQLVFTERVA